ncbi:zinc finger protein 711 [Symphorus nematophorus]
MKVNSKKGKLHPCQICFKNFVCPYKLSRHMVTHSGIRPYKCTLCSKTFTQNGHLKVHEQRCRQSNVISHNIQGEMTNTSPLQDKCTENLIDCTDFTVDATGQQPESHYTSVGHYSFIDADLSYCSEPIDTEWLAVPEVVGLKEENNESEDKQTENCNEATDDFSSSFPSELALEINKLVQSQNMAAPPLSPEFEGNAHYVEVPCQSTAISDCNELLCDELVSSVVENQMHSDNYLCKPLTVFECDKCTAGFKSENDLKQHICSTNAQPVMTESAQKNRCDFCFKCFVSPSKLQRHYVVHTGQRPYMCDICGKTFTQAGHVRTHRMTH